MPQLTLYHYVHCPYCVRVRLAMGFLGHHYTSVVLPYDDEATPKRLTGVKMLPIMDIDGKAMNESLDIIYKLDVDQLLRFDDLNQSREHIEKLLEKIGSYVHNLAMPYWIYTPEFNEKSRQYFESKKSAKRGPFKHLVWRRQEFEAPLQLLLKELELSLTPFYHSKHFGIIDIMLAAHLWGLYVVPEFQFPVAIHNYLQTVKDLTKFNYHEDFWR